MEKKYFTEKKLMIICSCMTVAMLVCAAVLPMMFPDEMLWVASSIYVFVALLPLVVIALHGFYPVVGARTLIFRHSLFRSLEKEFRFSDISRATAFSERYGSRITMQMKDGRIRSIFIRTSSTQLNELNKELSAHIAPEEPTIEVRETSGCKETDMTLSREKKYRSMFMPSICLYFFSELLSDKKIISRMYKI